jgi:hypothetical protein
MSEAERSTEVFSASLKLAIRSYSIRLKVVARDLQNLRRASLRHTIRHNPQGNGDAGKQHNALRDNHCDHSMEGAAGTQPPLGTKVKAA